MKTSELLHEMVIISAMHAGPASQKPSDAVEEQVQPPTVADDGIQANLLDLPPELQRTVVTKRIDPKLLDLSRWEPNASPRREKPQALRYLEGARSRFPGAIEATTRAGEAVARSHPLGRRSRWHDLAAGAR